MHIIMWHVNYDFVVGFSILCYNKKTHTITHIERVLSTVMSSSLAILYTYMDSNYLRSMYIG